MTRILIACVLLLAIGCSDSAAPSSSSSSALGSGSESGAPQKKGSSSAKDGCPEPTAAPVGTTVELQRLSDTVSAAEYPLADHPGNPWSQWGQGVIADGKFFSALGDECAVNGDSYVYEFDPSTSKLRLLDDVFSVVSHQPGAFGYGKIHAHMVRGADGALYATTYWGSERAVEYGNGYEGDVLLRIDPRTGELTNLGVPVAHHGIPSLAISLDGRLLFGEAADPDPASAKGVFFVYDLNQRKVVFQMEKPTGAPGYRCVLVDGSGKAWFSTGEGEVSTYDPAANSVTKSDQRIPGEFLRADSRPGPDGTVYGVSQGETPTFFSISKDGRMTTMGPARGYTASIALSSDGKTLYYVPDAHGKSYLNGTPVIALDTATGDEREIVRLNDLIQPAMNVRAGGSYNIALDDSARTLYVGLNAGDPSTKEAFGHVILAVVKLV